MIHPSAEVSPSATIGEGTKVWHQVQIRENARLGNNCIVGKCVYIDFGVSIGNNVKIQNMASVFHGTTIEDGVFIGPYVCFTNDKNPRAITPDGLLKTDDDWEVGQIVVGYGASIGARSVILPNVKIGCFAMIGAGSVVTNDVPDYGLVFGNPARLHGYVCKCGKQATKTDPDGRLTVVCSTCNVNFTVPKPVSH